MKFVLVAKGCWSWGEMVVTGPGGLQRVVCGTGQQLH